MYVFDMKAIEYLEAHVISWLHGCADKLPVTVRNQKGTGGEHPPWDDRGLYFLYVVVGRWRRPQLKRGRVRHNGS